MFDITFGQYFPSASPIHKLDPRAKLMLLIAFIVFVFIADIISLGVMYIGIVILMIISKVSVGLYLRNIKSILPIIIITAVLNVFYVSSGKELFNFWVITITTGGILRALTMALRIIALIVLSGMLTYTTTPTAITNGLEQLLSPFKFIGLRNAVHIMAMTMTIALRFIPTLIEETQKLMNAQKARGSDIEDGGLMKKVKALIPILIPLLISSVRRAYELAEAMECRCYNGADGRTKMNKLKFGWNDLIGAGVCFLFCAEVIIINFLTKGILPL